jgi:hypothetical protein
MISSSVSEYPRWKDSNFRTSRQNLSSKSTAFARSGCMAIVSGIKVYYRVFKGKITGKSLDSYRIRIFFPVVFQGIANS